MKKLSSKLCACALALACAALCGCGSEYGTATPAVSNITVSVAVTSEAYAKIIDAAGVGLAERAIDYEVVYFDTADDALAAVAAEEVDCAFVTSVPYLSAYNNANDTELTSKGAVLSARMGLYSNTLKSLEDLEGATIALPDDSLAISRSMYVLSGLGLVTLSDEEGSLTASEADIVENPSGLSFKYVDQTELVAALDSCDASLIYFAEAYDAGLDYTAALGTELSSLATSWKYADVIIIRSDNEAVDKFDKLIGAMMDKNIGDALEEEFGDACTALWNTTWGNV